VREYDGEFNGEDIGTFFLLNAKIFAFLIVFRDLLSFFKNPLTAVLGYLSLYLLFRTYYVIPYYMYKELSHLPENSHWKTHKYRYLTASILPFINIVLSVIYALRMKRTEKIDEGQDLDPYRSNWWKGTILGIALFLISMIFPIQGGTLEQALAGTAPTYFKSLGLSAIWIYLPIIPTTIYLDRKYLKTGKNIETGKILNILAVIPRLSVFIAIIYLLKRQVIVKHKSEK